MPGGIFPDACECIDLIAILRHFRRKSAHVGRFFTESGRDHAAASSFGNRIRLHAAAVSVTIQATRLWRLWRVLRMPPHVFIQPKHSSIRLRTRWLMA
jgi:hypothetical protein